MITNQIESLEWRVTGNPLATVNHDPQVWSPLWVGLSYIDDSSCWVIARCHSVLEKWLGMGKSPSSSVKNLSSLRYVEMNKSDFMRKAGFSTSTQRA